MNASNIFGAGFGVKRLECIYYNIDDVLDRKDDITLLDDIKNLKVLMRKQEHSLYHI